MATTDGLWPDDVVIPDGPAFDDLFDQAAKPRMDLSVYIDDPVGFWTDVLGLPREALEWSLLPEYEHHTWDGDKDPLAEMMRALVDPAYQHVVVTSGTGTGKTFALAAAILWWHGTRPQSLVATFAPKKEQMADSLWSEIGRLWPRFKRHSPDSVIKTLKIATGGGVDLGTEDIDSDESTSAVGKWKVIARATKVNQGETSATKAQGLHAEYMLLVLEEATGIERAVINALLNTCSKPDTNRIIAVGNPDSPDDVLSWLAGLKTSVPTRYIRASGYDHPNVVLNDKKIIPGAVTPGFVRDTELRDESEGHIMQWVHTRVRGMVPTDRDNALIHRKWCVAAIKRGKDAEEIAALQGAGNAAMGVDVARTGSDKSSLAIGVGAHLHTVLALRTPDLATFAERVAMEISSALLDPRYVGIDTDGLGAGVYDILRAKGLAVRSAAGSQGMVVIANMTERFPNLRSQMWYQMRLDLQAGLISLPDDDDLMSDLCSPMFEIKNGVVRVESKDDFKKRLGRSPDKGDAAVYWNWMRITRSGISERFTDGPPVRLGVLDSHSAPAVRRSYDNEGNTPTRRGPVRLGVL